MEYTNGMSLENCSDKSEIRSALFFLGADGKPEHITLSVGGSFSVARQRIVGDRTPLEIGRKVHGGRAISSRLLGGKHYGN